MFFCLFFCFDRVGFPDSFEGSNSVVPRWRLMSQKIPEVFFYLEEKENGFIRVRMKCVHGDTMYYVYGVLVPD